MTSRAEYRCNRRRGRLIHYLKTESLDHCKCPTSTRIDWLRCSQFASFHHPPARLGKYPRTGLAATGDGRDGASGSVRGTLP